jgi:hypothetical protein
MRLYVNLRRGCRMRAKTVFCLVKKREKESFLLEFLASLMIWLWTFLSSLYRAMNFWVEKGFVDVDVGKLYYGEVDWRKS